MLSKHKPFTILLNLIHPHTNKVDSFLSVATKSSQRRRKPRQGCSVTSVTASTSMTPRTVPPKCRCPTPPHTPPTTATSTKSGRTAISVRSLATGQSPATMTRPFKAFTSLKRTIRIFAHHTCSAGLSLCVFRARFMPCFSVIHASLKRS